MEHLEGMLNDSLDYLSSILESVGLNVNGRDKLVEGFNMKLDKDTREVEIVDTDTYSIAYNTKISKPVLVIKESYLLLDDDFMSLMFGFNKVRKQVQDVCQLMQVIAVVHSKGHTEFDTSDTLAELKSSKY